MTTITAITLHQWMQQQPDQFQLIDVRSPEEHADFNIGGLLMPMEEVLQRINEISTDLPVVIYCHHGIRSQIVIQKLEVKLGLTNLYNLAGGTHAWQLQWGKATR